MWKYCLEALKVINKTGNNHLGLRPSNILINDQGVIKICDYGYSKLREKMGVMGSST